MEQWNFTEKSNRIHQCCLSQRKIAKLITIIQFLPDLQHSTGKPQLRLSKCQLMSLHDSSPFKEYLHSDNLNQLEHFLLKKLHLIKILTVWSTLLTLTSKDSLFHHSKYLQYFSEKKSEISLRKLMSVPQIRKINKWLSLIRNKWHKSSLHTFFISLSESLSSMSGTWHGYERSIINPLVIKQLRNLVRVLCT